MASYGIIFTINMMGFYIKLISQHEMRGLVERAFRGERRNAFLCANRLPGLQT